MGLATAQIVPTGFQVDTLASTALPWPIDFAFLPDGRVLIANRAGELQVYAALPGGPPGSVGSIGTVPSVSTTGDGGLLSIEIAPDFAQTGHIYVYYSNSVDAFNHVDRFRLQGQLTAPWSTELSLDLPSQTTVLGNLPNATPIHKGGTLRFGPDEKLYLSLGDNALPCYAQSTQVARGCLLRMDVSGLPAGGNLVAPMFMALDPGDNPMSSQAGIGRLMLAHGLRNPFRFAIDEQTGNLYIGDVGSHGTEEINEYSYPTGALPFRNYGWPWFEGNAVYSTGCGTTVPGNLVAPIAEGLHSAGWTSIVQGPRYRNQGGPFDFGPNYEGCLFYADHLRGWIQRQEYTTAWAPAQPVAGQPSNENWGESTFRITAMRQGPDGALYWSQSPVGTNAGALRRVRPDASSSVSTFGSGCGTPALTLAGSAPPIIGTTAQVAIANAPTAFVFLAAGSSNSVWGPNALPHSLAGIGMPGCMLLQSSEFPGLVTTPTGAGTASFDWAIPNLGEVIGVQVYLQAWAVAPGQTPAHLIVSNGLAWRLGNS